MASKWRLVSLLLTGSVVLACSASSGGGGGGCPDGGNCGATGGAGNAPGGGGVGNAPGGGGVGNAPGGGGIGNAPGGGGIGNAPGGGGVGNTGGTGGTSQKRLGRACATDGECGAGLICIKATSTDFDGEGPGKGYCTTDCSTDDTVCSQFDPAATCLIFENKKAFCFEGCQFGDDGSGQFDAKKCHGRYESACRPLFDEQGNFTQPTCFPQCNADTDCGGGLKCNPQSGLCSTTTPTGKSLGEPCTQTDGGTDECKGVCIGFVHSGGTTPFTYMCAENCTVGATPSCGWAGPGTGAAPAACLFVSTAIIDNSPTGEAGFGDIGSCGQLCNCNSDCKNPALKCSAWTGANAQQIEQYFGKKGYCSDPLLDDGGTDPGIPTCS